MQEAPEAPPEPLKKNRRAPPPEDPPLTEEEIALLEQPEEDIPVPLLYREMEDGSKAPLEGVESVFLTGTTFEIIGCQVNTPPCHDRRGCAG